MSSPRLPGAFGVGPDGWIAAARRLESPNRDARPPGSRLELLVIHNISLPPGRFGTGCIEQLFTNRLDPSAHPYFAGLEGLRVSAHFLIDRSGVLTQFVSCLERAWHAGASQFEGRPACNDFSLGIELEGTDQRPYTQKQYRTLARLTRVLFTAFPLSAVRGHSDIAPARKTDPGPSFDWSRLARDLGLPASVLPPAARPVS
jgi:AmpD protein